jgi:two-component system NtrC family sensor kinase
MTKEALRSYAFSADKEVRCMATILVIDDEEHCRKSAAIALRKAGYSVFEAGNAAEGLTLARGKLPDLIISDVIMEGGDGVSLLKEIRSTTETATMPFIFMSGKADFATMTAGAEEAADGILPKPFTLQTLLSTVEKRLKREGSLRRRGEEMQLQLHNVLEASPDLVGMVDPRSGEFIFLNSSGRSMLGLGPHEELLALSLKEIRVPERVSEFESFAMPGALRDGLWTGETMFRKKSGETFPVKEYVQPHREPNGDVAYFAVIAHDLTQSKRFEEDRKSMELQLIQAHKLESIGQLAAGIAHEINTPTQYIGDNTRFLKDAFAGLVALLPKYAELLKAAKAGKIEPALIDEVESAESTADVEFMVTEIPQAIQQSLEGLERVTKIVRAMKDFSHPGVREKTMIDINHSIESTITVARNEWKYVAEMELQLDQSLPLVPCMPGEINQVVLNLVVNAAHAIEDVVANKPNTKGTITVSTARVGNAVEIRIKDTGAGIPEKLRKKIFEPFFTTKQVGKGTGQGLAIARGVIAKHGGDIDFESVVGIGTTFIVRLPIQTA